MDTINELENIMDNKETRRFEEGVYTVQREETTKEAARAANRLATPIKRATYPNNVMVQSHYATDQRATPGGQKTDQTGQFQWPCKNCVKVPGGEAAQKKVCTASQHCRWHGGNYMCTMDPKCRERTAKQEALLKYKLENLPVGQSVRQVKATLAFLDEELDQIGEEDIN